jgi:hypothetical protein
VYSPRRTLCQGTEVHEGFFGLGQALHDLLNLGAQVLRRILGPTFFGMAGSGFEMLAEAQLLGDLGVRSVVITNLSSDFREVVDAFRWNHAFALTHGIDGFAGLKANQSSDLLPQAVHATVSELAGDGGDDGQFLVSHIEHVSVAAHLLANGSQGVFAPSLFIFIKDDNIRNIEHFNLLELGVGAELGGHHVQRMVGHGRDGVAALADAARFTKNEVEANRFGDFDGSVEVGADLRAAASAGEAAHVEVVVGERVHADAVAKKGATGSLSGRVDAEQADLLARVVPLNAKHQFIEETGFSCTARSGETDDRDVLVRRTARLNGGLERLLVSRFGERQQQANLAMSSGVTGPSRLAMRSLPIKSTSLA